MSVIRRRRPKHVTIGETVFQVEYLKRVRLGIEGEIRFHERLIRVTDNAQWFETLFHEMLHASLYISGTAKKLSAKQEEAMVLAIEELLAPLLRLR